MTVSAPASLSTSGRLFGAILLISGTAIGAAMLALPVSTGRAGLMPSLLVMGASWLYLLYAAFCLLEVQLSMPKESNLITMAEYTLGPIGKIFSWVSYLFLLYALNTAYLSGVSTLFQDVLQTVTQVKISSWICMVPILAIFAFFLRKGASVVDFFNRLFMLGLALTFTFLLFFALPYVSKANMSHVDWQYAAPSIAVCLCAFGYHIVIPSVVTYLDRDVRLLKRSIVIGSAIPLVGYTIWQVVSLGMVQHPEEIHAAYSEGINSAELLANMTKNTAISSLQHSFSFFVMITSFLGVSLSLFDFLKDGLQKKATQVSRRMIFLIAFIPPVFFALYNKNIFLTALEYAGAYGVVILLALIPACMVWQKRYSLQLSSPYKAPGGKISLITFMAISICLILMQIVM